MAANTAPLIERLDYAGNHTLGGGDKQYQWHIREAAKALRTQQAEIERLQKKAQMEADVPVISVVLTPHHFHQSEKHQGYFLEHFKVKGQEAAQACIQVLSVRDEILAVA